MKFCPLRENTARHILRSLGVHEVAPGREPCHPRDVGTDSPNVSRFRRTIHLVSAPSVRSLEPLTSTNGSLAKRLSRDALSSHEIGSRHTEPTSQDLFRGRRFKGSILLSHSGRTSDRLTGSTSRPRPQIRELPSLTASSFLSRVRAEGPAQDPTKRSPI